MGKFADHLAKVGRQLGSAVNAYNDTVGSFDHRVIPQLRSIEAAGISSEREISSPAAIEPTARPVTARPETEPDMLNTAITKTAPTSEEASTPPITARRLASEAGTTESADESLVASEAR
jgi:DNA recombination protein RmuC